MNSQLEEQEIPGAPSGSRFAKIDVDSTTQMSQVEMSIHRWSAKYIELALEMRKMESTIHSLQQHKVEIMTDALEKIGVKMSDYEAVKMTPDGQVLLIPNPTPAPTPTDTPES